MSGPRASLHNLQQVVVHRCRVVLVDDQIQFQLLQRIDQEWVPDLPKPDLTVSCPAGLNVISFDIDSAFPAFFPSTPIQWIDHAQREITQYLPIPQPDCMDVQRDSDSRCSIWCSNLNFSGQRHSHAFLMVLLGADGKILGSSDPTIVNEPDEGTGTLTGNGDGSPEGGRGT